MTKKNRRCARRLIRLKCRVEPNDSTTLESVRRPTASAETFRALMSNSFYTKCQIPLLAVLLPRTALYRPTSKQTLPGSKPDCLAIAAHLPPFQISRNESIFVFILAYSSLPCITSVFLVFQRKEWPFFDS